MSSTAWKRIVASVLGLIVMFASAVALAYAIEGVGDFRNPAVPLHVTVIGELLMFTMSIAGFAMSMRFLRFAQSGRIDPSSSWVKPVLLGIGFFFPGFLFSLPLTIVWARHTWPGDGQSDLAAFEGRLYIGIVAAIICCIVLLRKRNHPA